VYRGNPFVIEAGLAFGNRPGDQSKPEQPPGPRAEGEEDDDDAELARVIRYANRVPLLYQQSACATFKAALNTTWKNYGVPQSRGALPAGPMVIFVHMASVWVPFTSESKEAIADYDEIQKEITLALRECGRRLGLFLRRRERAASEYRRRNIFELYIEEVVEACHRLKGGKLAKERVKMQLQKIANSRTGGSKTDDALGKTGGGPEGLPHSIIVTEEGVQGDVAAASQSEEATEPAESDLLGAMPAHAPTSKESGQKSKSKPQPSQAAPGRKTDQMALFEKGGDSKPTGKRAPVRSKARKAHHKK
jgi:DNA topoisomerase-6 subunit B